MTIKATLARIPLIRSILQPNVRPVPGDVKDFWAHMSGLYGSKVIEKPNALEMKAAAEFLSLMGIIDKEAFLKRYTTTLGKNIYIPFPLGFVNEYWTLWAQIKICVHEHVHIYQDDHAGGLKYEWDYITSSASRTHYEIEAYRSGMELEWRYQHRMLSPRAQANTLMNYACTAEDIKVAEKALGLSIPAIKAGGITHPVTSEAVRWLDVRFS